MVTKPALLSYATPRRRRPFDKRAWLIILLLAFGPVLLFVLTTILLCMSANRY